MTCFAHHSEVTQYLKNLHLYSVDGETLHCVQGGVHKRRMNFHLYSAGGENPIRLRSRTMAFAMLRVE